MPKVENAKNLKAFFFAPSGTTNLIPDGCRVTGFEVSSPTVSTREVEDIEAETEWTEFETEKITPGTATLNVDRAIDVAGIMEALESANSTSEEKYRGVFKLGVRDATGDASTTKKYKVAYSSEAILTEDMGLSGTAKQKISTAIKFQLCGKPKRGTTACNENLTITIATGAIASATATATS